MVKLCLGSAQFGLNYGVTNDSGVVPFEDVKSILHYAKTVGIFDIDTASSYGNAEKNIGKASSGLNIHTKIKPIPSAIIDDSDIHNLDLQLTRTLNYLESHTVHSLLVHDINDCQKEGSSKLLDWLKSLKYSNIVSNIGVSIYQCTDLANLDLDLFKTVQLPLSLLDQRAIQNKCLMHLKARDIKIFARSIFLQGLLLQPPISWPRWVKNKHKLKYSCFYDRAKCENRSLLELTLQFIQSLNEVDYAIFGVCNLPQLIELSDTWEGLKSINQDSDYEEWQCRDVSFVDPRNWPRA